MGIFDGLWGAKGTNETLKIQGPLGSDQYIFEYSINAEYNERVSIFFSDDTHSVLFHQNDTRSYIVIINANTFKIDNHVFIRKPEND